MKNIVISVFLLLCFTSVHASDCEHLYPYDIVIETSTSGELCKSFFVLVYDAKNHRPLFSSELFQPHDKSMVKRRGRFYNNVLNGLDVNHYPNGYDRGHLTPAADSISPIQMHDTFDSLNSAPQVPSFNRSDWKELEESIRNEFHVPVWIVTGLVWGDDQNIPTHFYKVVFMKPVNVSGVDETPIIAYIGDNIKGGQVRTISIHQLEEILGYKLISIK